MGKRVSVRMRVWKSTPRIVAAALTATVALSAMEAHAETIINKNITTNTTWTVGGSPYIIDQTIVLVKNQSTLSIDPGVEVRFNAGNALETDSGSSIRAVGTASDSILFTSNAATPAVSDWEHIQAFASPNSEFSHCIFEYGNDALYVNVSSLDVVRCRFSDCYRSIFINRASPNITDCWLTNAAYYAVWCQDYRSEPVLYHCNFIGNAMNMRLDHYSQPTTVVAIWNWWGTSSESQIEAGITDSEDEVGLGTVDYDPWLTQVPVEGSSWGRIKALFR